MITGATKVLAIFGNPVAHSLSPQMHNAWIADHGLDAVYVALPLGGEAEATLRALGNVGLVGANVTVPFKEAAARAADVQSEAVRTLGVANTLRRDQDGMLHAHNTDAEGARQAVVRAHGAGACDGHVLVIGAGGAAPAVGFGLARRKLTFINRTREKADRLATLAATHFDVEARARDWSDLSDAVAHADIIANTSTLGMKGQADIDWPLDRAKEDAIVFDAVYAPLETTLLQKARARGMRTVDGLGMLIHQGALAFEIWFGIKPDAAKARERLLKIIGARG